MNASQIDGQRPVLLLFCFVVFVLVLFDWIPKCIPGNLLAGCW